MGGVLPSDSCASSKFTLSKSTHTLLQILIAFFVPPAQERGLTPMKIFSPSSFILWSPSKHSAHSRAVIQYLRSAASRLRLVPCCCPAFNRTNFHEVVTVEECR